MKTDIEKRELITLEAGGMCLRGTYHRCEDDRSGSSQRRNQPNRIGVLFLNSGFMPRAADGDSAVHWAESFAARGYPSFRFDLPGLGDSEGDLPVLMLDFVHLVNAGRYASLLSAAAQNLTRRFNLGGLVIVGLCAGAVSAIHAAAATDEVKGLVLLDPYFYLQQAAAINGRNIGRHLKNVRDYLGHLGRLARGERLPRNANVPLIRCWNRLTAARVPMLVLTPSAPRPKVGEFDYLSKLTSQRNNRVIIKPIEHTNHSFVKGSGKEAVRRHVEQWLGDCFSFNEKDPNARPDTRVAVSLM